MEIHVSSSDGGSRSYFFSADTWLKKPGSLQVKLSASGEDPRQYQVTYDVTVLTSNVRRASTDASVFIDVKGPQGSSGPIELHSTQPDPFERGQVSATNCASNYFRGNALVFALHCLNGCASLPS